MNTVTVPVIGHLGDMYNKKYLYLGGMLLFTFSSLLCGLASSVGMLIGFRILQGLGAAFMAGLRTAIITEIFPSQERGRALGFVNSIAMLGVAIGPGLGGLLLGIKLYHLSVSSF
jgi:MFS family permease